MAFADEIVKLRRTRRCHLRFAGADNPSVSGSIGGEIPNLFGLGADNTGDYPVKGTVLRFGSFSRALTNYDQGFEIPTVSTELVDVGNQWRVWASRPWTIVNRFLYYTLRVLGDDGVYYDADVAHGQLTDPTFPSEGKMALRIEMLPGDYLGEKRPSRVVSIYDWPNADSSALGKTVPVIYGKMENAVTEITGFTGVIEGPSGAPVTNFAGVATTGGTTPGDAPGGSAPYYAIAPVDGTGKITAPPAIIGPIQTDTTNNAVALTWDAYPGPPSALRVWRMQDESFGQYDVYRDVHPYLPDDLPGTATNLTDTFVGVDTRTGYDPDPHWDLNYRKTAYYWISAVTAEGEQAAVGPLVFALQPLNLDGIRKITLSWNAAAGATSYKLRRAQSVYHYEYGYDREWSLSAATLSHEDFLTDTSAVNIPENFARKRVGAVECLYVDTNPAGTPGEYTYVVAAHGCKWVREVYSTKSAVTPAGNKTGSLDRPKGVAVTANTTGATFWRYKVTAYNNTGETLASNEVSVGDGAATPDNTITWEAVTDAVGYKVYRAGETGDFEYLATAGGVSHIDSGGSVVVGSYEPEANTSGTAYAAGSETSNPEPVLQVYGVDYTVTAVTINDSRYQVIKFTRSQEGNPVTCNVWGIENVGDATGNNDGSGLLIERGIQQFKHCLLNWVFNKYMSGPWYSDTGYQAGLLDLESFEIADEASAARIPGGYIGAGALTEQIDVRQLISDFLVSFDLDWYFWDDKFKVKLFDPTGISRSSLTQYTPQDTIIKGSFQISMDVTKLANKIPWQAGPQYDGYFLAGSEEDLPSQMPERYGRVIESQIITIWWSRDRATCVDVVQRRLRMVKNPPVRATFATPLRALNDEISTLVGVTHPDGISEVSTGWDVRACKIIRSDIDFDRCIVWLQVQDIDFLLAALGYVYYGDRTFTATDLVYATASDDRQSTYAYLADRATGVLSDGSAGKKLLSR